MLADAIKAWQKPYTVTRRVSGGYDANGRAIAPSTTTIAIQAVVVPLGGEQLERLPEGRRTREARAVFTITKLIPADSTHDPDTIAIDGRTFQVESLEDWTPGGFFEARVTLV